MGKTLLVVLQGDEQGLFREKMYGSTVVAGEREETTSVARLG